MYLNCINFHIEFDNIDVGIIYYPANLTIVTNKIHNKDAHKNKLDDYATPIQYVIVNKWAELALARQ